MALRNQPYLPFYVNDFMMDEKLRECSAESVGVYIFIICVLHKSEEYGVLTLKEKYFNENNEICGFAIMLAKYLPFQIDVIDRSLRELISEKVIILDGKKLIQKRMVNDNKLSEIRAKAGKKGGISAKICRSKTDSKMYSKKQNNETAKHIANTEYEIEYEININKEREYEGEKKELLSEFEKTIREFIQHRKKIKHPMTDGAIVKLRNKLEKIGSTDEERIEILNESIINGWQGVFPLKNKTQKCEDTPNPRELKKAEGTR